MVRKGGLPPLVEWHSILAGGKPTFLTMRFLTQSGNLDLEKEVTRPVFLSHLFCCESSIRQK